MTDGPRRILVLGATGPTGRALVRLATDRGHAVSALARRLETADMPAHVKLFRGDMLDASTLLPALRDQDAVLSAIGTKLSRRPTTQLSDGTRNLVAAMKQVGPRRLICITGIGAGDSRGHGGFIYDWLVLPLLLNEIYKDKTRQEQVIRESGLDWTIVRPAGLSNKPARGAVRIATDLAGFRGSTISRDDVAAFMLEELMANKFVKQAPSISN